MLAERTLLRNRPLDKHVLAYFHWICFWRRENKKNKLHLYSGLSNLVHQKTMRVLLFVVVLMTMLAIANAQLIHGMLHHRRTKELLEQEQTELLAAPALNATTHFYNEARVDHVASVFSPQARMRWRQVVHLSRCLTVRDRHILGLGRVTQINRRTHTHTSNFRAAMGHSK